ncbi:RNA polymerase-associated protein RapA [Corynebacterium cystitidis DSM 20524]|uniref:PLD-like domain-containing protein n=1 Tax=Corynebacterium cystitidis DSM 20524 TaxID=1121357 RepID=A0A1H9U6D2_9CORY|nr:RNA polymerase-associated protein RapA [Corynebacterium cystitidis DSM 20524]SES04811.1 PLD-like domain-containing protein [Corynebacterium cystitidis DSM 20524]
MPPFVKPLHGRAQGRQRVRNRLSAQQKHAIAQHGEELRLDSNLLGFSFEADRTARELVEWLNSTNENGAPRVEVRRLTKDFLHGKAYILHSRSADAVFAGSSNFTAAGLLSNRELNLGQYDPHTHEEVTEWFNSIWEEAEPYDLASLYSARWEPHTPQTVFGRMLWELYHDELQQEKEDRDGSSLSLTRFQADGAWRARRILRELHGVIIADEVGLGKTYLAGEIINEAIVERRQKVLIIAPATLRDSTWKPFLREHNLQTDVVSFDELSNSIDTAGKTSSKLQALDDYAMVVVDEAHGLRNPSSLRAAAMRQLVEGKSPKDIVLLTATPVNNSLRDVYTLISYFVTNDAQFVSVGVPSLQKYFKTAIDLHPDELSPEYLFDVLDQVAVRRTRRFVKNHYANDTVWINGEQRPITFPDPRVLRVDYYLNATMPNLFDTVAVALGALVDDSATEAGFIEASPGEVLTMARYVPSRFSVEEQTEDEAYQQQNAGLLRSALLKRFESSSIAYRKTLETLIQGHNTFLAALAKGVVLTGSALRDWGASESDDLHEFLADGDYDEGNFQPAVRFDVDGLQQYCKADLGLLKKLHEQALELEKLEDPKIEQLVEELATIAAEADHEGRTQQERRNKRKVLVFTYYADTAEYLSDQIQQAVALDERLADFRDRILTVTGKNADNRATLIAKFAPETAGSEGDEDLYDLVITTDVLAEGMNLQQARHIINYDLPWNPMRLVQRHGRIDRIGSPHDTVYMRCFFPDEHLDAMLGLEERIHNKLKLANASFGAGKGVLPGVEGREGTFTETRTQIEKLRSEDAGLFATGGGGAALSGEDYRRQLEKMLDNSITRGLIEDLPWGSGSGFKRPGNTAGIVFCARIADHPTPWFRYLPLDPATLEPLTWIDDTGQLKPDIVRDKLSALSHADPGAKERYLDDKMVDAALSTWEIAQEDIREHWNFQADPANTRPEIPRVMHEAMGLLRDHGAELGDAQNDITNRLMAPHNSRIQRQVRDVLKSDQNNKEKVQALADVVRRNNLAPAVQPTRQPKIDAEDINLICWTAITPE